MTFFAEQKREYGHAELDVFVNGYFTSLLSVPGVAFSV